MNSARPRAMIVEDEPLARERLARLLRARSDFELVAVCADGAQALAALDATPVDLLLLDIEMPGLNGMELLRRAAASAQAPLVVLTTAHAQFAVDAFAAQAVDYLLKPFDGARLDQALQLATQRLQSRAALRATSRIRAALDDVAAGTAHAAAAAPPPRLMVRDQGRIHVLRVDQVDWIQADGRRCRIHAGSAQYRIDGPLRRLAAQLGQCFVAVSRTALVNIERIVELHEMFKGNLVARLRSGAQIPISRRCCAGVMARLNGQPQRAADEAVAPR